jgi:hypothetical protein
MLSGEGPTVVADAPVMDSGQVLEFHPDVSEFILAQIHPCLRCSNVVPRRLDAHCDDRGH